MEDQFMPYFRPSIGEEEINEVADTLRSGWITMGKKTMEFERQLAEFTGAKHVIALNSCTDALDLSLAVLGIGRGDEVITTPYTFAATGNTIVHTGAKPVFVDIRKDTYNIDPEKIEAAITDKTKAIMPVDFAGQMYDVKAINEIAEKHDLYVIEDAAHSIGGRYEGKETGTFADMTCFSFYATKNITTGEGGAITTEDDAFADKCRLLRLHGISRSAWNRYAEKGSWYYEIEGCGWNYVMTDIQASLGIHQFKKLAGFIKRRREIGRMYSEEFAGMDSFITPYEIPGQEHPYHLYPLLLTEFDRSDFIAEMSKAKIGTGVHFMPLHLSPFYRDTFGFKRGDFPISEWVYDREVSLPLYPGMSDEDVKRVVSTVKRIVAGN
ncbi:MAG TPA: DegT/DnrJ/EryC1/StrS aminotransferase family protein [Candidatus Baltobacteraceae bacterium]|nr:DegT/DnrJ/EryC1/StrS aminotransferase family protein [Candidatus Baltobacteraceae bacterium]